MPSIHLFTLVHTASSHNTCTPNRTYANHSLNHLLLLIFKTPPTPSLGPSLPHAACVPRTTSCCRASSSSCWCASPPFFCVGFPNMSGCELTIGESIGRRGDVYKVFFEITPTGFISLIVIIEGIACLAKNVLWLVRLPLDPHAMYSMLASVAFMLDRVGQQRHACGGKAEAIRTVHSTTLMQASS